MSNNPHPSVAQVALELTKLIVEKRPSDYSDQKVLDIYALAYQTAKTN